MAFGCSVAQFRTLHFDNFSRLLHLYLRRNFPKLYRPGVVQRQNCRLPNLSRYCQNVEYCLSVSKLMVQYPKNASRKCNLDLELKTESELVLDSFNGEIGPTPCLLTVRQHDSTNNNYCFVRCELLCELPRFMFQV